MSGPVLVAGVGNIFFRDDAFGVEVAKRLSGRELPPGADVGDFGIRSVHLAYEVAEKYSSLILVDALDLGETPGTLAVLDVLDAGERFRSPAAYLGDGVAGVGGVDGHTLSPATVLSCAARLGASLERVVVVGCQPATVEEGEGLSPPVAAAVDRAVELCLELAREGANQAQKGNMQ
jgi:hydrogenase maturation protease